MDNMSTDEAEFLKQTELKWNKAIQDNLPDEMAKYMDDEWIIFSGDGNITTKDTFLQHVKSGDPYTILKAMSGMITNDLRLPFHFRSIRPK
jgi:hypothetical protein